MYVCTYVYVCIRTYVCMYVCMYNNIICMNALCLVCMYYILCMCICWCDREDCRVPDGIYNNLEMWWQLGGNNLSTQEMR